MLGGWYVGQGAGFREALLWKHRIRGPGFGRLIPRLPSSAITTTLRPGFPSRNRRGQLTNPRHGLQDDLGGVVLGSEPELLGLRVALGRNR
jgi:hypothetical protein